MRPNGLGGCPGIAVVKPPPRDDVNRDQTKGDGIIYSLPFEEGRGGVVRYYSNMVCP